MLLLVLFLTLFLASPGWAAVAWDAVTTASASNVDADTTHTVAHTIGSITNGYVGVCVFMDGADVDVSALTIGGVAGTLLTEIADGTAKLEMWGRPTGSTTGSVDVAVTTDVADQFRVWPFSLSGVHQSVSVGTPQTAVGSTTSLSVSLTATASDMNIQCTQTGTTPADLVPGTNQTERAESQSGTNGTDQELNSAPGDDSPTSITWTGDAGSITAAIPFLQATSSSRRPHPSIMLGD
jgi:hypothetical protein